MANELVTKFIFDEAEAGRRIDLTRKNLVSLNNDFNNLGKNLNVGKTIGSEFKTAGTAAASFKNTVNNSLKIDEPLRKALDDIKNYQQQTIKGEREVTKSIEREARLQTNIRNREQRRSANNFLGSLKDNRPQSGGASEVLSGLGVPLGTAAVTAFAVSYGKEALKASKEAANSQLQLQSISKETGLAYEKLTAQAQKFGDVNLLSNREAQSTFAQIANFANAAGRADKLDEFRQKFSDLAAAKGINANQLGDISRQLNALTDEATDKLLNANPSAFYDKFAKSIGKTAAQLTDAEKRAAIFDEVLRKGAIFDGAAEQRFNSSASAVDKLSQKFENLKANIGKAVEPLAQFTNFLTDLAVADPKLYQSDAEKEAIRNNERILGQKRVDEIVKDLRASDERIRAASANPLGSIENFALSKVNIATGFFDEKTRNKAIEDATKQAVDFRDSLQKRIENALSGGDSSLAKFAFEDFKKFGNLFDLDTREKFQKGFSQVISAGFQKAIAQAKEDVPKLQKTLSEILGSSALNADAKNSLSTQINEQIKRVIDTAKDKLNDFRSSFSSLSAGGNPLVKLMSDFETATDRAEKQFGSFGKEVVKQIAAIERANLQKAINLQSFQNNLEALNLTQEAERLRATPENQFAPFQRNLETVERKVDSLSKIFQLNRQIDEAGYYANQFNPNNPRSFNQSRGFDDSSAKIRNAVSDILGLKSLDIGSTGIFGKEAVADKILDSIPSRDELLTKLRDPRTSGDAQFLLNQQFSALQVKREAERQKLNDFLENQKFLEFGKQFANEKIGLINNSNITDAQKAEQRLAVTNALGNDLDINLRRQKAEDLLATAANKQKETEEAKKVAEDTKTAVQAVLKLLSEKGIKIDGGIGVTVKNETGGAADVSVDRASDQTDVDALYGDYQNALNRRF